MKRIVWLLPVIAVVLLTIGAADAPKKTVFSGLKVGQRVGLKDHGTAFEISVIDDVPQSHKIIEIGEDFVVLEDVAEVTQTIPVYSLKAIVRLDVK